jgi:oligopeptide transport system substrate-binding protein
MKRAKPASVGALAMTFFMALVMVLAACGTTPSSQPGGTNQGSAPQKASADKQVFNWPLVGIADIKTFDPAMATTQTSIQAIQMVFTGLVTLDPKLNVVGELASSWKQSEDGKSWTFTLKDGLKFSDGTPLTSQDVVYSIDRALDKDLNSPASPSYLNLVQDFDKRLSGAVKTLIGTSLIASDPKTVVIKVNSPVAYFLQTLTYNTAYVVEKSLVDKYGQTKWTDHLSEGGGAGPWKVQTYDHGKQIVFVPNENYYGTKPQLTKVVFPFIKDAETAYKSYQTGQIDQAAVPSAHLTEAQKSKEYHKVPVLATFYFGMNEFAKPFDTLNIRKALALAINKDILVHAVFKDVDVATNHIVPQGMPGYNPNLKGPDGTTSTAGNPDMAKQLFAQGLKDGGYANAAALPPIKLSYPSGSPDTDNMVAVVVKQWNDVLGINVQATPVDFETLSAAQPNTVGNASLQFFFAGWGADYPDAQDFLTLLFSPGPNNATNFGQNKTPESAAQIAVQQSLAQADVERDPAKRLQMYNEAEQLMVDQVAWMPLYQLARSRLLKSYVIGREFNAQDFTPYADWGNIFIAVH